EVHGELPGVVTHKVEVDLTPAQRRIYRQFEEEALAWLGDNPVAAGVPITKMIRLRETILAVPSVDENGSVVFKSNAKSAKIDLMSDIPTDLPDEQVVVWTHRRKIVPAVLEQLRKDGYVAEPVIGGQSKKVREATLAGFKAGEIDAIV